MAGEMNTKGAIMPPLEWGMPTISCGVRCVPFVHGWPWRTLKATSREVVPSDMEG